MLDIMRLLFVLKKENNKICPHKKENNNKKSNNNYNFGYDEATVLYITIPVWMTFTFSQGYNCMRNQKLQLPFSLKYLNWFC